MTLHDRIIQELETLSDPAVDEVIDFIRFLKTKEQKEKLEYLSFAESALKKDWLLPEENDAWQDL